LRPGEKLFRGLDKTKGKVQKNWSSGKHDIQTQLCIDTIDFQNWYFGLRFCDRDNQEDWLDLEEKIVKQNVKVESDGRIKLFFKFRFIPENVEDDFIRETSLRLLFKQVWFKTWFSKWQFVEICLSSTLTSQCESYYIDTNHSMLHVLEYSNMLQVCNDILQESLFCPEEKMILLASYQAQAKFGNHIAEKCPKGYLTEEKYFPYRVLITQKLCNPMQNWEDLVRDFNVLESITFDLVKYM
jgi:hypothetical protein